MLWFTDSSTVVSVREYHFLCVAKRKFSAFGTSLRGTNVSWLRFIVVLKQSNILGSCLNTIYFPITIAITIVLPKNLLRSQVVKDDPRRETC